MAAITLNLNVGMLGHIDSGKTSLAKALSTVASTACFDKNPQSKERGITLDLGFSSFSVPFPQHLQQANQTYDKLQFTLVDCPGHASLIRTVIGGSQIIDLMLLIVDVTKGMQTQTAECLVIGEITCGKMMVVLNKTDLLPKDKRQQLVDKMTKKMLKTLEKTKFAGAPVIAIAAKPGGQESDAEATGVEELVAVLCQHAHIPVRSPDGPFVFSVDHCFSIKGQGTVMTGTVVQGSVNINDAIEFPSMKVTKKVKSMQMFRKPIEMAIQGDRVGICVTQFDPKHLERGIICSPGYIVPTKVAIASVNKIPYYKNTCPSKGKFHISIMHETVMAKATFFSYSNTGVKHEESSNGEQPVTFEYSQEYQYQEELFEADNNSTSAGNVTRFPRKQFVLLEFEKPISVSHNSLFIGSRLDTDIHSNVCRLAFHGVVIEMLDERQHIDMLPKLKVFKWKTKEGVIERMVNEQEVIGKSLFKKETNIQIFLGLRVQLSTGETGVIEGSFGQSGKVKIRILGCLDSTTQSKLAISKKKAKGNADTVSAESGTTLEQVKMTLAFKRFIFDPQKKIIQT